jgi:hypothetical protein
LIVLGAGSSLPLGMPSVREIDERMKEWSYGYTNPPAYPKGATGEGIFNQLWKLQEKYRAKDPRPQLGLSVNFERVLGEMTSLASWASPPQFGNPLIEAVKDGRIDIEWPPGVEGPYGHRIMVIEQQAHLLGELARYIRGKCRSLDLSASEFQAFKRILDGLRDRFEVGVYSLNYDDVALRAWPEAYTGFIGENFDPRGIASREAWSFIYHLHGSVHYTLADTMITHAIKWKPDLGAADFEDTYHLNPDMASGFVPIIPATLIAGGYKLDQILANPAQSFYASLVRHAQQADAILSIGYGFGDVHMNRALQNRMQLSPYHPAERPRAAVVTYTPKSGARIGDRQGHEFFAWQLTHTLNVRFPGAGSLPQPQPLETLIDENLPEQDMVGRVCVWHNGFLEVEPQLERLTRWLENR